MDTQQRPRVWHVYDVLTKHGHRTSINRIPEPDEALTAARQAAARAGPALPDTLHEPDALRRLITGERLEAHCVDGTIVTVGAVDFRSPV